MSDLLVKMQSVRADVKTAALTEYLRRAQRVHTIAFLQWRLKFPTPLRWDGDLLEELIEQRVEMLHENLKNGIKPQFLPKVYGCDEKLYRKFAEVLGPA